MARSDLQGVAWSTFLLSVDGEQSHVVASASPPELSWEEREHLQA